MCLGTVNSGYNTDSRATCAGLQTHLPASAPTSQLFISPCTVVNSIIKD
jgi:hypothetical protein